MYYIPFQAIEELVIIVIIGVFAGIIGALTGIGGGGILTPFLVLFFGVPIPYATGASYIATIATSSGAASAYVRDRITNVRIGTGLQVTTTAGAIVGSLTAFYIYSHSLDFLIYIIFGIILFSNIPSMLYRRRYELPSKKPADFTTRIFKLNGAYYDPVLQREVNYIGRRWWLASLIMFFAGIISGLLGIGAGALKVLAMDWAMNLPIRVSTTTSNFMIGVTAAAGSSIYWLFGYIQPFIAAGTAIGVTIGSYYGTKILMKITSRTIRNIFTVLLVYIGTEMVLRGIYRLGIFFPLYFEYLIPLVAALIFVFIIFYIIK